MLITDSFPLSMDFVESKKRIKDSNRNREDAQHGRCLQFHLLLELDVNVYGSVKGHFHYSLPLL